MERPAKINNISWVAKNNLCTGCGTCVSLCPSNAVSLVIDKKKGIYHPKIYESKCNKCGICINVCPGHEVDFEQLNRKIFGKQQRDSIIGNYVQCYTGYSANQKIRFNCTSGGLVTQILIYALENKLIDGALLTRMKKDNPLEPEPFIARTTEEICDARGSKYCPVPANIALKEILDSPECEKYAVVGLPCQIHGIRKAELINENLKKRIVLHLGLFCGAPMNFNGTDFLMKKYKIDAGSIARLDYRSHGWPGYMKIKFKDGFNRLISREDYGFYQSFGFFIPRRCVFCCDQLNEMADISLGDAWLPKLVDRTGTSAIISRNKLSDTLLQDSMENGKIVLSSLDGKKFYLMETKKVSYPLKYHLANLRGYALPSYNISLPTVGFFPFYLLFYTCVMLPLHHINMTLSSKSYLEIFIGPSAKIERLLIKSVGRLVKLRNK